MSSFDSLAPNPSRSGTSTSVERETPALDRRRSPRFQVSGSCRVVIFDGVEARHAYGTIRDISRDGIRVHSSMRALPGMKAELAVSGAVILGEVRHCTPASDGGFDLGFLIEAATGDWIPNPPELPGRNSGGE